MNLIKSITFLDSTPQNFFGPLIFFFFFLIVIFVAIENPQFCFVLFWLFLDFTLKSLI